MILLRSSPQNYLHPDIIFTSCSLGNSLKQVYFVLFIKLYLYNYLSMVLPVYKVLSLVIRVFSKPLVTYTKQVHLKNDSASQNPYIRKAFINLGNYYNRMQTYINRKFMKIQSQFAYKPLNDELAIEKGIQFFYEIIFYSIVIGLPLYEMIRASNQAKVKSKALDQKLKYIDETLKAMLEKENRKQQVQTMAQEKLQILNQAKIQVEKQINNQIKNQIANQVKNQIKNQVRNEKLNQLHLQNLIKNQKMIPINQIKLNLSDKKNHIYRIYYAPVPTNEKSQQKPPVNN